MATLVFIFVGMLIGAALVGAFLMGRERGRTKAIDDVARTMGGQLAGRNERSHAEMTVGDKAELGGRQGNGLRNRVEHHEIVAEAVHFGKFQEHKAT